MTETCKRNSVAELDQKEPVKDDYPGSPHQRQRTELNGNDLEHLYRTTQKLDHFFSNKKIPKELVKITTTAVFVQGSPA